MYKTFIETSVVKLRKLEKPKCLLMANGYIYIHTMGYNVDMKKSKMIIYEPI